MNPTLNPTPPLHLARTVSLFLILSLTSCTFQKQVYRAVDDKQVVTLQTANELEFSAGGTNYLCKYAKENNSLRVTMNMFGTTQVVYFQVVPEGLKDPQGIIFY